VMAEVLEITQSALARWTQRQSAEKAHDNRRGRPEAVPAAARERIRACYKTHFGEWGPQILREWCLREGVGRWCAATMGQVIADLKETEERHKPHRRYEVTRTGVMWSEDGAGFRQSGRKWELLVAQDEHSRYKVGHRLVSGPAKEDDVVAYLEVAFREHGAPLVLKHDGAAIFHSKKMRELLAKWEVMDLTGPRYWPCYNGKKERSIRDIKSYERAMRRAGVRGTLQKRLDLTIADLNEDRPRPMLGGRTAREAYEQGWGELPSRALLKEEVRLQEKRLQAAATCRHQHRAARRRAIELVLSSHGLLRETGDVSHDFLADRRTD
jgi:hypothetical protein